MNATAALMPYGLWFNASVRGEDEVNSALNEQENVCSPTLD